MSPRRSGIRVRSLETAPPFLREGSTALEPNRIATSDPSSERSEEMMDGAPAHARFAPKRGEVELPAVALATERGFYQRYGKRIFDSCAAAFALVLLSPVFLVIAIAIRLEGKGPIYYCSSRVGRGGRVFRFYKFRSMVVGADTYRDHLLHRNEADGPVFKIADDPRITRVGRFLRRSSLDELPQFWNVLRGDMSLVGPRPPIPSEVLSYEPWQARRLSVRPGITCLWQISGRSRIGFDEWMRLDMEYIDRRSFPLDLAILVRTLPAVMSGEGAY